MTTPEKNTPGTKVPTVLVIDYGGPHAQLMARRIREAQVYSEVVPHWKGAQEILAQDPAAIIITGGEGEFSVDPALLEAQIPALAVGSSFAAVAEVLGASSQEIEATIAQHQVQGLDTNATLFSGQVAEQYVSVSSHKVITQLPDSLFATAHIEGLGVAGYEAPKQRIFGVLWDPETDQTEYGQALLKNFLYIAADLAAEWTAQKFIEDQVQLIKEQIGDKRAIVGLSGGVDSAVAAALVQRAVGDQLTAVYVNHGLMRKNESVEIERAFGESTGGAKLVMVDAEEYFLSALEGVSEPETKRKIIGERFIRTFEKAQTDIVAESAADPNATDVKFLVQGTVYPDIVESGAGDGANVIKSHHNVGGLPEDLDFELVEPLKALFKDEVRAVGTELGLPDEIVWRQPFPGPGLGIRIVGTLTRERLDLLREADAIVREELTEAGLNRSVWQCPVVLLADVRSVGMTDGSRTYGHPVVLRPVTSEDAMTADWAKLPYELLSKISNRITAEVDGINRVVLDVTPKPPGTIEWE